jgi:Isoleucyl-tRNA synthetase
MKRFDLHKPWIDEIILSCPQTDQDLRRLPDVLDCWFESASMPYGQLHYPFENVSLFEK